jgi:hypothetical protein
LISDSSPLQATQLTSLQELDFGFGSGPTAMRWLVTPLASDMAVIRPAMPPYGQGLLIHMALSQRKLQQLRMHALLRELSPDAVFLGDGK